MPVETTVLLIEASTLPSSLEEQLTRRSVFAEHASQAQVSQVVPVVVPDLVIQSGKSRIPETIAELAQIENAPPLVVISDRATIRRLREEGHTEISALIPQDLPIAAIAHRIATMARRSSQGEPLEHKTGAVPVRTPMMTLPGVGGRTPSMGPPAPESSASPAPVAEKPNDEAPSTSKRGSLAPQPLAGHQSVKIFDAEEEKQRAEVAAKQQRESVEAKRKALKLAAKAEADERREKEQAARLKRAEEAKARQEELKNKRAEEAAARREKEQQARELRASQRPAAAAQSSDDSPSAMQGPPATQAPPATQGSNAQSTPPPAPRRPSSTPPKRASITASLGGSSSYRPAPIIEAEDEELSPSLPRTTPHSLPEDDELSVVAPLPVDIRLPLSGKSANRSTVRLALLDTDLTRADSVCAALRREGLEIFPVTPQVATTRWPMLRRFAPQGLVVDEKSMVRGAAEWVETFRGDLFLRHVPVVLMRFSRLFRDNSGSVELEALLKLIEPLGKEEFALLQKLKPGRQVDLRSSQIPPFRLVQLLTEQDRNTRLDCQGDTERIVWPLGPGYAGKAKLLNLGSERVLAKLSPEDAMSWLLGHDDCAISVHEHSDPLAHPSQSQDSQVLLNEMTEAVGTPSRHQSAPPGPGSSLRSASLLPPILGTLPPPAALSTGLSSSRTETKGGETVTSGTSSVPSGLNIEPEGGGNFASTLRAREISAAFPGTASEKAAHSVAPETPYAVSLPVGESIAQRARAMGGVVQEKSQHAWQAYQTSLTPLREKMPERVLFALSIALPVLTVLIMLSVVISLSSDSQQHVAEQAVDAPGAAAGKTGSTETSTPDTSSQDTQGQTETQAKTNTKATGTADANGAVDPNEAPDPNDIELWKVAPDSGMATCEEKLGPAAPSSESPSRAIGYWKQARRLLMQGKSEEALEMMCLAGLFDPSGPAAEGLAEYYLAQRALTEAERWVKLSLKADGKRRQSHELLGDIESQKGHSEQALKIWLDTMRLSGDEQAKMQAIARKLVQDANLARRGGDLPRAERSLRRAAALAPESAAIAAELAEIFLQRDTLPAAEKWASRALRLDANFSGAKILSGRIAEAASKPNDARDFYRSVPPGDPHYPQAQKRLEQVD